MDIAGFAAACKGLAERAQDSLALDVCGECAKDYLAILRAVTPKRTGALMGSETITGPSGGGAHAAAEAGPHIIYAEFRDQGGTISVKHKRVLSDGKSFFGKTVHQHGAHYMAKANAAAQGPCAEAAATVLAEFISL